MKPKRIVVFAMLVSVLLFAPQAYTAPFWDIPSTSYNVSDFAGSTADFSFWDYNPITFSYTTTAGDAFDVEFKFTAPQNWDEANSAYTNFTPEKLFGLTSSSFNDVYGYFYRVTETAGTGLGSMRIDYDKSKATVFSNNSIDDLAYANVSTGVFSGGYLGTFFDGSGPGATLLSETSDWFYMTSKNWWGWDTMTADSVTTGFGLTGSVLLNDYVYSPSGQIPSPNPEAPTIALYLMGLFGVGWFTRMKYFIKEKI